VLEYGRTIRLQVLVVDDSLRAIAQYLGEALLTFRKRLVSSIKSKAASVTSCARRPTRSASKSDRPSGQQTTASPSIRKDLTLKRLGGIDDGRETLSPVMPASSKTTHLDAFTAYHEPKTIVLDFVDPLRT
jgi:hypothetical protein